MQKAGSNSPLDNVATGWSQLEARTMCCSTEKYVGYDRQCTRGFSETLVLLLYSSRSELLSVPGVTSRIKELSGFTRACAKVTLEKNGNCAMRRGY